MPSLTIRHSIIIPAYNERERLPAYLDEWIALLDRMGESYEILVVDDGSSDGTREYVLDRARTAPHLKLLKNRVNSGKGYTIRHGMSKARGELRLFADADGATAADQYERLLRYFDPATYPIAIGVRIPLRGMTNIDRKMSRHYTGRIFSTVVTQISGLQLYDTQCGFKLFSAEAARALFPMVKCKGWAFDVEVLLLAERLGFGIAEVPVNWHEVGGSKLRLSRAVPQMVRDIIAIRWRHRGVENTEA